MKSPMRILLVDDSTVYRTGLSRMFSTVDDFQVVDTARDGEIALRKLAERPVDAVLLDFEMPIMDGLATLTEIRKSYKKMIVIMFSSHTAKGASITLEALMLGANDYVLKPTTDSEHGITMEQAFGELTTKLRALDNREPSGGFEKHETTVRSNTGLVIRPRLIAVGASTGGPLALEQFLGALGPAVHVPIVIVQHMPPMFTKQLAGILSKKTERQVIEAQTGMPLTQDCTYIAPGNFHMIVKPAGDNGVIELNQDPPENFCRPAVDVLYRSCARAYGKFLVAVQLTGMGHDGMKGAQEIVAAGGEVIAQDQASAVVFSMPQSVIKQGLATLVLPPAQIATEIAARLLGKTLRSA